MRRGGGVRDLLWLLESSTTKLNMLGVGAVATLLRERKHRAKVAPDLAAIAFSLSPPLASERLSTFFEATFFPVAWNFPMPRSKAASSTASHFPHAKDMNSSLSIPPLLSVSIFRNAFVYNKPGQPDGVRECAEKLSLVFEKELAKM